MPFQGPVDEISGVQDRETRHVAEAGGCHPVVVTDPNDVGVGVVRVKDRIDEGAVSEVGGPGGRGRYEAIEPEGRGYWQAESSHLPYGQFCDPPGSQLGEVGVVVEPVGKPWVFGGLEV
jgi:hypothetical protein